MTDDRLYQIIIAALLRRKGGATVIYEGELTAPPAEIRCFPHTDPETGKRTLRVDIIDLDKNVIEDHSDRRRATRTRSRYSQTLARTDKDR
jgi:hypothetical protein